MNGAAIAACLWVLAAALVALLPMRRQFAPGIVLLGLAPVLMIWLSLTYGLWVGGVALLAFLSMFRRPLIYLVKRLFGQSQTRPDEGDRG
jgi:hypothetical protein